MLTMGEKIKETCILLLLNIFLPTLDVYSDLALIVKLFLIGSPNYAGILIVPFLLNYSISWVKMWHLEKCRILPMVSAFLSCYPQYLAVRVIQLLWKDANKGLEKKKRLEREVSEMETFLEAVPSTIVITFFLTQIYYKEEFEVSLYNEMTNDKGANDWESVLIIGEGVNQNLFFVCYGSSILSASIGLAKSLKVGPCRILPECGYGSGRFLLILLSVSLTFVMKVVVVAMLIGDIEIAYNLPMRFAAIIAVLVLPQLLLALLSICKYPAEPLTVITHPSLLLLPIFTYFTFTTSPFRKRIHNKEVEIRFSQSWTLGNIILNVLLGFIMLIWNELYLIWILLSTLGTIIFLFSYKCCVCLPAPQIAVLRTADPLTEFVVVEDNCGKQIVITLQQWKEMDDEAWSRMELHEYSETEDNMAFEIEVLSELNHR